MNREAVLPPPVQNPHHSAVATRILERFTLAGRVSGKLPQWICRLAGSLWSREGAAVLSQRNTSCLVMASLSLGGGWLFPGLPPFGGYATCQSQGLTTWLISGQRPAPATAQGLASWEQPWHLAVSLLCQAGPGTAVWGCLSWLLSPQLLLICQKCKYSKLGFRPQNCLRARENAGAAWKALASLTAVRALTLLNRVYRTSSTQISFTWSRALEGDLASC